MNLFEILEKEIIYKILPLDLYAILMLTSTSKTVKNAIFDNIHNGHKVKVCFKQSDYSYLDNYNFCTNIENISNKFTIDKLYLQIFEIQNSDIIFIIQRCPLLTFLSLTFLNDLDHLKNLKNLNKLKNNMPNCKVCLKYNEKIMENLFLNKFESNQMNNYGFINLKLPNAITKNLITKVTLSNKKIEFKLNCCI